MERRKKLIFYLSYILPFFFFAFFSSCEIYNPPEDIPSYIHIEKINLSTDLSSQGSNSSKITDAWVYLDDQLLGVFELPATFPVLKQGQHEIKIRAGIKSNGIAATRVAYPFYNFYDETITLTRGITITVNPTIKYISGTSFAWLENFESQGASIVRGAVSDTTLEITHVGSEVFEGSGSGKVEMNANQHFFECTSSTSFPKPLAGAPVYLELNYKCNNSFAVGVIVSGIQQPVSLNVRASNEWKKIYIDLSPEIGGASGNDFEVYIGLIKDESVANPQLIIDNIKLLY